MVEKMMYDQRQKEVRIELIAFHVLCVCVCVCVCGSGVVERQVV